MQIVQKLKLLNYAKKHVETKSNITSWVEVVERVTWKKGIDILASYPTAKLIPAKWARFKIVGNKYRLIVEVNYILETVDIRFIGTHTEYDRISDVTTI